MNSARRLLAAAWDRTFARYVVVGVANTAFAYAVYAGALFAGASYPLASLISLALGILVSFKTQGTIVFQNASNSLFGRYVLGWLLAYLVNIGIITLFVRLGQDAFIAGALALPFNVALGFVLQRYFVFVKK